MKSSKLFALEIFIELASTTLNETDTFYIFLLIDLHTLVSFLSCIYLLFITVASFLHSYPYNNFSVNKAN